MAGSEHRQRRAHRVGTGAGALAGAASAPFGAAKLRDSYKESYPAAFGRGLGRLERAARQSGAGQQSTARLVRVTARGKPGFAPLAVATGAAAVAGGARQYERHLSGRDHKVTKSALGVALGKTDTGSGYRPATSMTADEHRRAAFHRAEARDLREASAHVRREAGGGSLTRVYAAHDGYPGHAVEPGIAAAVADSTRPSTVHPRIHYGSTVSPAFERHLDRTIHPSAVAGLRHPVVFHSGATTPGAVAAAAGAHVTTGNRGHIIFNPDYVGDGGLTRRQRVTFRSVVHHELVHAARHGQNPARPRSPVSHLGEEARADAVGVPGAGAYRRNKVVPGRLVAAGFARMGAHHDMPALGVAQRYHQVHRQVRSAVARPPGLLAETAHSVGSHPKRLAVTAVAAGGAGALHHRKARVTKALEVVSLSGFVVRAGGVVKSAFGIELPASVSKGGGYYAATSAAERAARNLKPLRDPPQSLVDLSDKAHEAHRISVGTGGDHPEARARHELSHKLNNEAADLARAHGVSDLAQVHSALARTAHFNFMHTTRRPIGKDFRPAGPGVAKADQGQRLGLASGTGSALAARGAVRSRKAGHGHLLRAADLERDSNTAFTAARQQGDVVTQRLVRHTTSGPGSLPRTSGNLAGTGKAHLKQQAHLQAGLNARDASHAATAAGRKAMGRSKGKLALAAGLGSAAAVSTSRKRY